MYFILIKILKNALFLQPLYFESNFEKYRYRPTDTRLLVGRVFASGTCFRVACACFTQTALCRRCLVSRIIRYAVVRSFLHPKSAALTDRAPGTRERHRESARCGTGSTAGCHPRTRGPRVAVARPLHVRLKDARRSIAGPPSAVLERSLRVAHFGARGRKNRDFSTGSSVTSPFLAIFVTFPSYLLDHSL